MAKRKLTTATKKRIDETANEYRFRVADPSKFIPGSFRTTEIAPGINMIAGKIKGGTGSMVAQSFRFKKSMWKLDKARTWMKGHMLERLKTKKKKSTKRINPSTRKTRKSAGRSKTATRRNAATGTRQRAATEKILAQGQEVQKAKDFHKGFTWGRDAKSSFKGEIAIPGKNDVLVCLGKLNAVEYTATKGDTGRQRYRHPFKRGAEPVLLTDPDGKYLFISGGRSKTATRRNAATGTRQRAATEKILAQGREAQKAKDFYKGFTWGNDAKSSFKGEIAIPEKNDVLVCLGKLNAVEYTATKGDTGRQRYRHTFKRGAEPVLLTDPDGKYLFISGGNFKVTERGIEG